MNGVIFGPERKPDAPEHCDWCDDIVTQFVPGAVFDGAWYSWGNGRSDCLDSPSHRHEVTA